MCQQIYFYGKIIFIPPQSICFYLHTPTKHKEKISYPGQIPSAPVYAILNDRSLIFYLCYKIFGKCTEVCCSRRSLLLTIDFIHFLYRGFVIWKEFIRFFVCGDQNLGSLNREFVIQRVRYIEGIYKRLIVQNPRGTAFGSLYRDVRYTGGSLYRESTV